MTKRDIVVKVAEDTGLNQSEIAAVVQKTLGYMADELAAGHGIEFRDFGVFEIVTRKSRKGRNPKKPQDEVVIPSRCVVKFRAGKELGARVLKLGKN